MKFKNLIAWDVNPKVRIVTMLFCGFMLVTIFGVQKFITAVQGAFAWLVNSWATPAYAEYTSLISASDFTGIETDVGTAATGIVSIALIILGVGILISAIRSAH